MNRTDRLVAMVLRLQGRRVVRASELAAHFGITERTVYRDIAALGEAGVPISGEAGGGYSPPQGFQPPPGGFTARAAPPPFFRGGLVQQLTPAPPPAPPAAPLRNPPPA